MALEADGRPGSDCLHRLGWQVTRASAHFLLSSSDAASELQAQLRRQHFQLFYMEYPKARDLQGKTLSRFWQRAATWIRAAADGGVPVILYGTKGAHWADATASNSIGKRLF